VARAVVVQNIFWILETDELDLLPIALGQAEAKKNNKQFNRTKHE